MARSLQLRFRAIGATLALCGGVACAHRTSLAALPHMPTAMERQIQNAADLGDGDIELKLLRARVSSDPKDLTARMALAAHYSAKGLPELAIEHLQLACERAPQSAEAHIALAKALRQAGRVQEALQSVQQFQGSPNADILAWTGILLDESGDWKAGEKAHRSALEMAPERDILHNNLGYCLLRQGHKKEAAEEFRAALRINKSSATAQDNLGIALASTPSEAVLHWQSVSDPASAHSNMAAVLIESGKYTEARQEIGLALGYNRQHPAALTNLVLLSQLDGKPADYHPLESPSRWNRIRAAWQRFLIGDATSGGVEKDSGKAVASR